MPEQAGAPLLSSQLKAAGPVPLGWGHWLKLWLPLLLGEGTPMSSRPCCFSRCPWTPFRAPMGPEWRICFCGPGGWMDLACAPLHTWDISLGQRAKISYRCGDSWRKMLNRIGYDT